jgi:hypothetical protein
MIWTDEATDRLRRMVAAGCTDREIACAMQVTQRTITGKRQRLGIILRASDPITIALRRARREQRQQRETQP